MLNAELSEKQNTAAYRQAESMLSGWVNVQVVQVFIVPTSLKTSLLLPGPFIFACQNNIIEPL